MWLRSICLEDTDYLVQGIACELERNLNVVLIFHSINKTLVSLTFLSFSSILGIPKSWNLYICVYTSIFIRV